MTGDSFHSPREPFAEGSLAGFFAWSQAARNVWEGFERFLTTKDCAILTLTGEAGLGKTTLARQLFSSAQGAGPATLLRVLGPGAVHEDGGRAVADDRKAGNVAADLGERLARADGVVFLDDADKLGVEDLRALANACVAPSAGAARRLVLVGRPELLAKLASAREPALDRAAAFRLLPFSRQETEDYVRACLLACGRQDAAVFSDRALDLVHLYSGGVPARIDLLCREALLYARAEDAPGVSADLVERVRADGLPGLSGTEQAGAEDFAFTVDEPAEEFEFEEAESQPEPAADGAIEERLRAIEERLASMQTLIERLVERLEVGREIDRD